MSPRAAAFALARALPVAPRRRLTVCAATLIGSWLIWQRPTTVGNTVLVWWTWLSVGAVVLLWLLLPAAVKAKQKAKNAGGVRHVVTVVAVTGGGVVNLWLAWARPAWLFTANAALTLAVVGWWLATQVLPTQTGRGALRRRETRQQLAGGAASVWDLAQYASPASLRARAGVLRPSLRGSFPWRHCTVSAWTLTRAFLPGTLCAVVPVALTCLGWLPLRAAAACSLFFAALLAHRVSRWVPVEELGYELARMGLGGWGQRVYTSIESITLRTGGPRCGKTISLARHGNRCRGALITTSTRTDLARSLQRKRRKLGPVHVFNASGVAGATNTIRWSILASCASYAVAASRADAMIPTSESSEGERWDQQARGVMALLLHAAALGHLRMLDLSRWVTGLTSGVVPDDIRHEIIECLSLMPGSAARIQEIRAFIRWPERTRGSVVAMMAKALRWLGDDTARAIGDAPRDEVNLDVRRLIEHGETLHIIGHEDLGTLSPLTSALVAEIARQARALANENGGRLDPGATILLDEAAITARVPLDRWTADFGGANIAIHISVQSLSQLNDRWGEAGAETILGNVSAFLVFGGSTSADDLKRISLLTGEHRERVLDADGKKDPEWFEHRWVPTMSIGQLRALPEGHCLVLMRGIDPILGRARAVYQDALRVGKWTIAGWRPMDLPVPERLDVNADITAWEPVGVGS